jgi:phage terminase small subunit
MKKTHPRGLSDEAGQLWARTVELWRLDDPTGLLCLTNACRALDRLRDAEKMLAKEGSIVRDRFGQPRQHPAHLVARDEGKALRECLKMLALDLESLHPPDGEDTE